MERRKAVIAAATASLTLLAGAAAVSINSGIVGASGDDGVGKVQPVDTTAPGTVYVDVPATQNRGTDPGSSSRATVSARSPGADDADDDGEDDLSHDRSGVGAEHEYEGAEDDD